MEDKRLPSDGFHGNNLLISHHKLRAIQVTPPHPPHPTPPPPAPAAAKDIRLFNQIMIVSPRSFRADSQRPRMIFFLKGGFRRLACFSSQTKAAGSSTLKARVFSSVAAFSWDGGLRWMLKLMAAFQVLREGGKPSVDVQLHVRASVWCKFFFFFFFFCVPL